MAIIAIWAPEVLLVLLMRKHAVRRPSAHQGIVVRIVQTDDSDPLRGISLVPAAWLRVAVAEWL